MNPVIDNYLELAKTAKNAGNNEQCEQYCNKILEIENNNAMAWALKGSAAGWQSSLASPRIEEMLVCYGTAINYALDDQQAKALEEQANTEYVHVVNAMFDLQCERFQKWPDAEEAGAFNKLFISTITAGINMMKHSRIALRCITNLDEIRFPLAVKVNNCAVDAEKLIRQNYASSNGGLPSDYDFRELLEKEGYCYIVLTTAVAMGENDDEGNIIRWKNMINNHEYCISACSYEQRYDDFTESWYYAKNLTLNADSVQTRRGIIADLKQKISAAEERIRRRRFNAYWEAHAEEKSRLEEEKRNLSHERVKLANEQIRCKQSESVKQVQDEIADLEKRKAALGFFALKEKKALSAQLADRKAAREKMLSTLLGPLDERMKQIDQRLRSIDTELTCDR